MIKQYLKDKDYWVTECGYVYSDKGPRFKLVNPTVTHDGYLLITVSGKPVRLHRFVAEVFYRELCKGDVVMHLDNNKFNNSVENLMIGTNAENIEQARIDGLLKRPKGWNNTKITDAEVVDILESGETIISLAKQYNVSKLTIINIRKGRGRRKITVPWLKINNPKQLSWSKHSENK